MRQYHDCCRRETEKLTCWSISATSRCYNDSRSYCHDYRVCSVRFGDLLLLRLLCFGAYLLLLRLFLHKALY